MRARTAAACATLLLPAALVPAAARAESVAIDVSARAWADRQVAADDRGRAVVLFAGRDGPPRVVTLDRSGVRSARIPGGATNVATSGAALRGGVATVVWTSFAKPSRNLVASWTVDDPVGRARVLSGSDRLALLPVAALADGTGGVVGEDQDGAVRLTTVRGDGPLSTRELRAGDRTGNAPDALLTTRDGDAFVAVNGRGDSRLELLRAGAAGDVASLGGSLVVTGRYVSGRAGLGPDGVPTVLASVQRAGVRLRRVEPGAGVGVVLDLSADGDGLRPRLVGDVARLINRGRYVLARVTDDGATATLRVPRLLPALRDENEQDLGLDAEGRAYVAGTTSRSHPRIELVRGRPGAGPLESVRLPGTCRSPTLGVSPDGHAAVAALCRRAGRGFVPALFSVAPTDFAPVS